MRPALPPIVLDASIALAFILDEEVSPAIRARIGRWVDQGERFAVPSVFWLEVVNVLGRRRRLPGRVVLESLYHLDDLGITTIEPDRVQLMLTVGRVEQYGLTAYDAAYLSLAHSLPAKVATIDRQLAEAAGGYLIDPIADDLRHRIGETPAVYESEGTWPEFKGASAFLARLRAEARKPDEGFSRDR